MAKRRELVARHKWLPAFCAVATFSLLGIAGGGEGAGQSSPAAVSTGLHPSSPLSPSDGPQNLTFTETQVTFPNPSTSISATGVFGGWRVYDDAGPAYQFLFYNDAQFVQAIPTPNFFGLQAAPLRDGLVFLGFNAVSGQAQLEQAHISDSQPPTVTTYPLTLDLSQGGFIRGNFFGDYVGGSPTSGTVFVHWDRMPAGQVVYYNQPTNSLPVDATWNPGAGFFVLDRGTRGLYQFPLDFSAPKYVALSFTPSGLTTGPTGNLFVADHDQGIIHELDPLGHQINQYPVGAPMYGLYFVSWGNSPPTTPSATEAVRGEAQDGPLEIAAGLQQPTDLVFVDLQASLACGCPKKAAFTLAGNKSPLDVHIVPGSHLKILVDEFNHDTAKGEVLEILAEGWPTNVNLVWRALFDAGVFDVPLGIRKGPKP